MDLKEYFNSLTRSDYQKDNFDDFLSSIKFKYSIPSIHIAGTNGKGSTAIYIANIYKKAGYKVGLYTSPYFYKFNEAVKVNDEEIKDDDIVSIIEEYKKKINKFELSAFEVQTFVALSYFAKCNCDIAVIECGMGGELDATNIFDPILSIITSISLEHTSFLGRSLFEITEQKAGIIKNNIPTLIGKLERESIDYIADVCKDLNSKLHIVNDYHFFEVVNDGSIFTYTPFKDVKLQSVAEYSAYDASLAIEATQILSDRFVVSKANIKDGLYDVSIPLRMERLLPNNHLIVDGGHNPEGINKLKIAMENIQKGRQIHVVFACFRDKNIQSMLETLSLLSPDLTITTFDHPRARTMDEYFLYLESYKFEEDYIKLINDKLKTYKDDIILVCGSLAFASQVRLSFMKGDIKDE